MNYASFIQNSLSKEIEIDKQFALLGLIDPKYVEMNGEGNSSTISDSTIDASTEVNQALAINIAYLSRKDLADRNSPLFKDISEYFEAYIINYNKMIDESSEQDVQDKELARLVKSIAQDPKHFADHMTHSMSQVNIDKEESQITLNDIKDGLFAELTKNRESESSGTQLRALTVSGMYNFYLSMYNNGVIGAGWFIYYIGRMAFDSQQGPPKTIYEKYFVSTQSLFAFTSALELYKLLVRSFQLELQTLSLILLTQVPWEWH